MLAFNVHLNNERLCTAGVGEDGVLTAILSWVKRKDEDEQCDFEVAGLVSAPQEHLSWIQRHLKTGDRIRIDIVETEMGDSPGVRNRRDPVDDLERQKQHVRTMAERFAWTIQEKT